MSRDLKNPLGELLIEKGIITRDQLNIALKEQEKTGGMLGATLLKLGFVDEETIFMPIVAGQLGVEYVSCNNLDIPKEVLDKVPAKIASYYKILPFKLDGNVLSIASVKPLDINMLDEIGLVINLSLKAYLAGEKDIVESIRKYYGVGAETIERMMGHANFVETKQEDEITEIDETDSEASISKFLNQILIQAYNDRATDIHIEPFEKQMTIRYRVDGVLVDAKVPRNIWHFKDAIVSRIKILSNLNIAEKRKPQDGRFKIHTGEIEIDLRVSFLPTPYGESVVLRVLSSTELYSLEELGFSPKEKDIIENLIKAPNGIIFLTGPTGSGKTTTLYSCLSRINSEDKKIITIEDPIEYRLKGVTQIQINPKIGLTFAEGLRSMLRHDPDVMMVGEVRDVETATIAIQVALTGHLVFSTLHTNDASSGVTRLIDMGIEPYMITSTVECFIAQRLVRVLCEDCKFPIKLTEEMWKHFQAVEGAAREGEYFDSKGCEKCKTTGYKGRVSIFEMLLLNDTICELIIQKAGAHTIKEKAREFGMKTLLEVGWEKVKSGLTSPQEIIRVTKEAQD